jgi:hypothetical protein
VNIRNPAATITRCHAGHDLFADSWNN